MIYSNERTPDSLYIIANIYINIICINICAYLCTWALCRTIVYFVLKYIRENYYYIRKSK